jgi:quercetin dioxygenase-like cupin family protein
MFVQKEQLFVQFDQIAWDDRGGGVRRKVMTYADRLMGVFVEFKKDAVGAIHSHPHVQFTYIQSGSFNVHIGTETQILRGGDFYFIPSDVPHGVEALEDSILLDVFTPMRSDFIPVAG